MNAFASISVHRVVNSPASESMLQGPRVSSFGRCGQGQRWSGVGGKGAENVNLCYVSCVADKQNVLLNIHVEFCYSCLNAY